MEHMEYFHLAKMTGMIIFKRLKTEKWEVDYSDIQAVVLYPNKVGVLGSYAL